MPGVYVHDIVEQSVTTRRRSPRPALPVLRRFPAAGPARAVVLVLHGGRARSRERTAAHQLAYRRMVPLARAVHRELRSSGVAVWLLRNRLRGWNEPDLDAVADAHWAVDEARRELPSARLVVVGHSMGGRAALRVAGRGGVVGVCALAPWIEPGDPVGQLAGRMVAIAHGDRDRVTDPVGSFDYAERAREVAEGVCRFEVQGSGHAMVRRSRDWTGLVRAFCAGAVGVAPMDPRISAALAAPAPDGLRYALPAGVW